MTKIITRAALEAKRARHLQHAKAVYFFSGVVLPPFPSYGRLATSSLTITSKTLFTCFQRAYPHA
jgi:hypothetical protein